MIALLLYLLSWFLPTDSPWSPIWATSTQIARKLCKLAGLNSKDLFIELGSGTGTACVVAGKEFGARAIGIESSRSRVWWSKLKAKRHAVESRVTFLQKNFYEVDLSNATVVYLYLVPRVIKKLKHKLMKELKPGTLVISYTYEIEYLPLLKEDYQNQLFVYKIPTGKKK